MNRKKKMFKARQQAYFLYLINKILIKDFISIVVACSMLFANTICLAGDEAVADVGKTVLPELRGTLEDIAECFGRAITTDDVTVIERGGELGNLPFLSELDLPNYLSEGALGNLPIEIRDYSLGDLSLSSIAGIESNHQSTLACTRNGEPEWAIRRSVKDGEVSFTVMWEEEGEYTELAVDADGTIRRVMHVRTSGDYRGVYVYESDDPEGYGQILISDWDNSMANPANHNLPYTEEVQDRFDNYLDYLPSVEEFFSDTATYIAETPEEDRVNSDLNVRAIPYIVWNENMVDDTPADAFVHSGGTVVFAQVDIDVSKAEAFKSIMDEFYRSLEILAGEEGGAGGSAVDPTVDAQVASEWIGEFAHDALGEAFEIYGVAGAMMAAVLDTWAVATSSFRFCFDFTKAYETYTPVVVDPVTLNYYFDTPEIDATQPLDFSDQDFVAGLFGGHLEAGNIDQSEYDAILAQYEYFRLLSLDYNDSAFGEAFGTPVAFDPVNYGEQVEVYVSDFRDNGNIGALENLAERMGLYKYAFLTWLEKRYPQFLVDDGTAITAGQISFSPKWAQFDVADALGLVATIYTLRVEALSMLGGVLKGAGWVANKASWVKVAQALNTYSASLNGAALTYAGFSEYAALRGISEHKILTALGFAPGTGAAYGLISRAVYFSLVGPATQALNGDPMPETFQSYLYGIGDQFATGVIYSGMFGYVMPLMQGGAGGSILLANLKNQAMFWVSEIYLEEYLLQKAAETIHDRYDPRGWDTAVLWDKEFYGNLAEIFNPLEIMMLIGTDIKSGTHGGRNTVLAVGGLYALGLIVEGLERATGVKLFGG
ncbi:MAG: hypothetical protein P9X27_04400 [Candidatus Kaelpia aquatica]|nr:hypothetical protein [Candidatus Kaelpia aquatica]